MSDSTKSVNIMAVQDEQVHAKVSSHCNMEVESINTIDQEAPSVANINGHPSSGTAESSLPGGSGVSIPGPEDPSIKTAGGVTGMFSHPGPSTYIPHKHLEYIGGGCFMTEEVLTIVVSASSTENANEGHVPATQNAAPEAAKEVKPHNTGMYASKVILPYETSGRILTHTV